MFSLAVTIPLCSGIERGLEADLSPWLLTSGAIEARDYDDL